MSTSKQESSLDKWEVIFRAKIASQTRGEDPAHDFLHFSRVVRTAKAICQIEKADFNIVVPAAWLHDLVNVQKDDPRRQFASRLSAEAAIDYLRSIRYPGEYFEAIAHAISAHSFSAGIAPIKLEAKIVQDADRLDGLGAIGIARCFAVAGMLKRDFYSENDPFCTERTPDDQKFTIDHFYEKLFKTAESMQTRSGKQEGLRRLQIMKTYLKDFAQETGF